MSGGYVNAAAARRAPSKRGTGSDRVQYIAAEGSVEAHNAIPLPKGRRATLLIGGEDVRVVFTGEAGMTSQVASTDLLLRAGASFEWIVTDADCVVYTLGASAHEAWVWPSSNRV